MHKYIEHTHLVHQLTRIPSLKPADESLDYQIAVCDTFRKIFCSKNV